MLGSDTELHTPTLELLGLLSEAAEDTGVQEAAAIFKVIGRFVFPSIL